MTTVMLRLCEKFLFENHSYYQNNYFLEESEGKNENVWDDYTFSASRNPLLDLFDLSQLRSLQVSFCYDCGKCLLFFM